VSGYQCPFMCGGRQGHGRCPAAIALYPSDISRYRGELGRVSSLYRPVSLLNRYHKTCAALLDTTRFSPGAAATVIVAASPSRLPLTTRPWPPAWRRLHHPDVPVRQRCSTAVLRQLRRALHATATGGQQREQLLAQHDAADEPFASRTAAGVHHNWEAVVSVGTERLHHRPDLERTWERGGAG
jgi:hypothetical protein